MTQPSRWTRAAVILDLAIHVAWEALAFFALALTPQRATA